MALNLSPTTSRRSTLFTTTDSPPPLVFSDASSDDLNEDMERNMEKEDVSAVMQKVLGHLTQIEIHLRQNDENDAANEISKKTYSIIGIFQDATAAWDFDKCQMNVPTGRAEPSNLTTNTNGSSRGYGGRTWAAITATDAGHNNRLVKFRPSDGLKRSMTEDRPAPNGMDFRVLWIQPWVPPRTSRDISKILSNSGALLSVAYSEDDQAVCVIFQHAYQAQAVLEENAERIRRVGHGIFGPGSEVLPGQAYPKNEDLRRMEQPINERRRLTFARSALFTTSNDGMSEDRFKRDLFAMVGEQNVELVWLFNTGNATVVFSATVIARMVKDEFRQRAKAPGPYKDVQVSFSHDPCERDMHLVTQMHGRNEMGPPSQPGNANHTALGNGTSGRRSSASAARPAADEDGWQTVRRR